MRRCNSCDRPAGFTLLELLAAMTLLGLLTALLFGGVRFGTRVWAEGERGLTQLEEVQAARGVLRRVLSQAVPHVGEQPTMQLVLFHGAARRIDLIGPAPARSMRGALYRIRLYEDRSLGRSRLMLAWRPAEDILDLPLDTRFEEDETAVLLDGIADLRFSYFGLATDDFAGAAEWHTEWRQQPELPERIALAVRFPGGDTRFWVDLVVAPMIDAWTQGRNGAGDGRHLGEPALAFVPGAGPMRGGRDGA